MRTANVENRGVLAAVTFKAYQPQMFAAMVVANDLVFRRGTQSPTVRIDGLTMASV